MIIAATVFLLAAMLIIAISDSGTLRIFAALIVYITSVIILDWLRMDREPEPIPQTASISFLDDIEISK